MRRKGALGPRASFAMTIGLTLTLTTLASADDPRAPSPGRGVWRSFQPSTRLSRGLPTAALIDGTWSLALAFQAELPSRAWAPPYPWGTIGNYSTRILYGTAWTVAIGGEALAVLALTGAGLDGVAEATYRTDMIGTFDLPACPHPGARGGCGVGVGGYSYLQVRPRGSHVVFEAGGGFIQQRVLNDALRTVSESQLILSPVTALYSLETNPDGEVALRVRAGPGVFFGMHNGHVHPTPRGRDVYHDLPWHQMFPLDVGAGPGGRVEGRVAIHQHLVVEADLTMAPLVIGGPESQVSAEVAPLDRPRHGVSVFRRIIAGVGWDDPNLLPFKPTLSFFATELSDRAIDRIGYQGLLLRFDVPLKVPALD